MEYNMLGSNVAKFNEYFRKRPNYRRAINNQFKNRNVKKHINL